MLRVGLTGGLATGKSHVGEYLAGMGCHLMKADEIGHQALEPGGGAFSEVISAFGRGILNQAGEIDRRALGEIVFKDTGQLALLNSLVHPVVIGAEQEWYEQLEREDPNGIGIVEAAILIETGSYKRFQKIILTVCDPEQQIERAMSRDRLSRREVEARLSRQMSLDEKRKHADFIVDTSGDKNETLIQTRRVYKQLRSMMP